MIEYKNVKIFTDNIEQSALQQVYYLQKSNLFGDEPIRIMPDCHSGAGCVIGFTAPLTDKVCPNIVGVDLNCGMLCVYLGKVDIDLKKFDVSKLVSGTHPRLCHIIKFFFSIPFLLIQKLFRWASQWIRLLSVSTLSQSRNQDT